MAALVGYFFNETTLNKQARVLLFYKKKNVWKMSQLHVEALTNL